YEVRVLHDSRKHTLMLRAEDFNKLENLQKQVATQLINTAANISGCNLYMKDLLHKYINLADWEYEREGTSLIGLEVINEQKYFCAPSGIYGLDGSVSDQIMYMGNEQSNVDEVKKLDN